MGAHLLGCSEKLRELSGAKRRLALWGAVIAADGAHSLRLLPWLALRLPGSRSSPLSFLFLPGLWQELRPTLILLVPAAPPCGSRSPDHSIILEFCWYQGIRPTEDGSIKIVLNKVFAIKKEKEEKKKKTEGGGLFRQEDGEAHR